MDLAVLITARNEMFLANTVEDVLAHAEAQTEVWVVLDGGPAVTPLTTDPRVHVIALDQSIGQRAAVNLAARSTTADYVMKLDAHCAVDQGFDRKLIEPYETGELTREATTIPRLYNLHAFDWQCRACSARIYQGARPETCTTCQKADGFDRLMLWQPRWSRRTDYTRFDSQLHYQYWQDYEKRPSTKAEGEIGETMTALGACFLMRRDRFWEVEGMDEASGSWGQFGVEIACKSWLSGGRHVVNKRTWYSHMFRTHGGPEWGFPYQLSERQVQVARRRSRDMWMHNTWPKQTRPLSWLLDKFWPVPDWDQEAGVANLALVRAEGDRFAQREVAA